MNNLVKEGLAFGAGGAVLGYVKSVPLFFWRKIKARFSVTVDIADTRSAGGSDENQCIAWIENYLAEKKEQKTRNLKVTTQYREDDDDYDYPVKSNYNYSLIKDVINNPGWFKFNGSRLLITCHRREAQNSGDIFYDYELTFFTRRTEIAKEFLDEIQKMHEDKFVNKVTSKIWKSERWTKVKDINPRTFDTVILPEGDVEKIKEDLDLFTSRKQLYKDLNINHKRGYLFEGLPGTGKSTIANAIAYYLQWDLYAFNKMDMKSGLGSNLSTAFSKVKARSVVLIEDIDTYKINREDDKEAEDTGDWLNWLDGINSPSDCVIVMTTNHVDRLDPALIRDGRVDFSMNFSYATEYQIRESFKRFHLNANENEIEEFVANHKNRNLVMADIQNDLFKLYVPAWRGL